MKWQAVIFKEHNGFMVKFNDAEGAYNQLYEEKEDNSLTPNESNKEHVVKMLFDLIEFFGEQGDRYDKQRIRISLERGDKYGGN